jgi:hypothetical protein
MTFRSRKLLDLAHTMPCKAKFTHHCGAPWTGAEPAHSDQQIFGRGFSHKSHDCFFASMCHTAHVALDTFDREAKQAEWLRAYIATQEHLWQEGLICVNPKRVVA